jgi:two-component system cell cycle response regulator DivK
VATASNSRSKLVLLVDDDTDSRFLYAQYLTSVAGYRVVEAADGRQAIDLASELRPDVIVMDLSLPVIDGWDAMRALRSDDRTRLIPIVLLTGHAQIRAAHGTDFQAVLVKPCLPDTLVRQVEALLAG